MLSWETRDAKADSPLTARIVQALARLSINESNDKSGGPTNIKIRAISRHLNMICGAFGDGAENKRIPPALFGIEGDLLEHLIDGYRATDGSEQSRRSMPRGNVLQARWKIPSVSLQLLRDFQRLLLRQGVFASIHKCWPGGPQTIMGRQVQTKPRWELNVRLDPQKRTVFEFADEAAWVRVRDIEHRDDDDVAVALSLRQEI